jgi:uncharacterized protein (DUF1499 family)
VTRAFRRSLLRAAVLLLAVVATIPLWVTPALNLILPEDQAAMLDIRQVKLSAWKQNEYLVTPPGFAAAAAPHREAPVFRKDAANVAAAFRRVIERQPRIEWTERGDMRFEVIQRSAFFRFPDRVTVDVLPLDGASATLAIYSRSRYGRRDFGVNRARIDAWLAELERELK